MTGAEAIDRSSGYYLAKIGLQFGLFNEADSKAVKEALGKIEGVRKQEKSPTPVKTGATWMSH